MKLDKRGRGVEVAKGHMCHDSGTGSQSGRAQGRDGRERDT